VHFWNYGGTAFSPGRLSAKSQPGVELSGYSSHATFEGDCQLCHKPLEAAQGSLCTNCHENVAQQINTHIGTHSYMNSVEKCANCHSDHRGPGYDPTDSALDKFDHSRTDFSLAKHQYGYEASNIGCFACHEDQAHFSVIVVNCISCHTQGEMDFVLHHIEQYGDNCLICHDGVDRMVAFNHDSTDFPLDGGHAMVSCTQCHQIDESTNPQRSAAIKSGVFLIGDSHTSTGENDPFTNTPRECVSCHNEPPLHEGVFTVQCSQCHSTVSWSPATLNDRNFSHNDHTVINLVQHGQDFSGAQLNCYDCHGEQIYDFQVNACIDCHTQDAGKPDFISAHIEGYGTACLDCHDGIDRMDNFNHDEIFLLEERHTEIDCQACHTNLVYRGTPKLCYECHAEPDIHTGFFGQKCQYCHNQSKWTPAYLSVHTFPLGHGSQESSPCQTCHIDRYSEYTCYGCHEHQREAVITSHLQAGIHEAEIPACAMCHQEATGLR
jgi:hypothetical protein